jgi:peptidyl-prolyl cis-trans isomerase A (cyclophilin A)
MFARRIAVRRSRREFRLAFALALLLTACPSQQEREAELTAQCKKDTPCKKQGLCTGLCSPEPCRCVVGSNADCIQSTPCEAQGQCTAKDGKCVVASNQDCARSTPCRASGFCSAKDGVCLAGSDADCSQSDLCKSAHKCGAKNGACIDASFNPALLNPALANAQAPEKYKVKFTTKKGDFVVEVTRAWSPLGAERLYNLVKIGYYNGVAFHEVDEAVVAFGIHANPEVTAAWHEATFRDEAPKQPNDRGYVAFPKGRPNSRWAPIIIHRKSNRELDQVGYAPIGKVVQGMNVIDALPSPAKDIDPIKLETAGDAYLKATFPGADYITSATLL